VVAANHFAHQFIGVSSKNLMNLKCNELFCKSSKICPDCPVKHTFETGETSFKPTSIQTPGSNKMVHYELYTYSLKGSNNEIYEVILYAKDVTQSKELQREIAQSEKMVSIGKLAADVAHELKNPLAIISASAQFCLERLNLDSTVKEHLEVIYRNTQNSNKILTDLLSFAKPNEIMFKSVNINWVFNSSLKLLLGEFSKAQIQVRRNLSPEIPEIQGDAKSLVQVFINILINAVQATGEKGRIYVRTSYDAVSHKVIAVIKDNGSGIPEEHLEKIFDPFFTTKLRGTGLGLSICQRIIVEHQGTIRVKSKKDKGTEFIIEFPEKLLLKK
jgi:two-component system sensor histidine kinase HydH